MHLNKQKIKDDDFKNYKISIKSLKLFEYFRVLPIMYLFIPFEIWKKLKNHILSSLFRILFFTIFYLIRFIKR